MALNKEKIRQRVAKAIEKMPSEAVIKRPELNEFEEATENETTICTINGLYHKGNTTLNINMVEGGVVTSNKKEFLMVVYDTAAQLIKAGDNLYLGAAETLYKVQDLGNSHDIYLDMLIEKV